MGRHQDSSTHYLADTFNPDSRSHCCPCWLPCSHRYFLRHVTQAGDLVFSSKGDKWLMGLSLGFSEILPYARPGPRIQGMVLTAGLGAIQWPSSLSLSTPGFLVAFCLTS